MNPPHTVAQVLADTGPILLDFDGPVCAVFATVPDHAVTDELRRVLQATSRPQAPDWADCPPASSPSTPPDARSRHRHRPGRLAEDRRPRRRPGHSRTETAVPPSAAHRRPPGPRPTPPPATHPSAWHWQTSSPPWPAGSRRSSPPIDQLSAVRTSGGTKETAPTQQTAHHHASIGSHRAPAIKEAGPERPASDDGG